MTFLPPDRMNPGLLIRFARRQVFAPNRADIIALCYMAIAGAAVARHSGGADHWASRWPA